ncbi:MAG: hypothetical protein KC636_25815 [Myxococcales bacterium]|nr:hypothetical protein [Myxococcales bacterium]
MSDTPPAPAQGSSSVGIIAVVLIVLAGAGGVAYFLMSAPPCQQLSQEIMKISGEEAGSASQLEQAMKGLGITDERCEEGLKTLHEARGTDREQAVATRLMFEYATEMNLHPERAVTLPPEAKKE